jgi:hypothetical protein
MGREFLDTRPAACRQTVPEGEGLAKRRDAGRRAPTRCGNGVPSGHEQRPEQDGLQHFPRGIPKPHGGAWPARCGPAEYPRVGFRLTGAGPNGRTVLREALKRVALFV